MATLFVFLVDTAGNPVTGAAPTFDVWNKAVPGAPVTGLAMTELTGGIGGGYFADFVTVDGLEYLAIIDGTAAASPRYQRVAFSGTTDERIEVDVPDILADTTAIEPLVDVAVSSRATQASVDAIATTGGAGPWTTASGFSTHSAADVDTVLSGTHGPGSWEGAGLTAAQAIQLQEAWTALGLNTAAPASFDFPGLFMQALANTTPIDVVISVVGTTVTLTRQP